MSDDDYLTVPEVAKKLKSSPRFVLDELRRKNLRGTKLGSGWRVGRSDLKAYMDAKANVSPVRRSS